MSTHAPAVLLLEDEPLISMDVEATLQADGFDVTAVMSCVEAEEYLQICRPDVVIVDIALRDGPSGKIVQQLIEATIPFVVHSGKHVSEFAGTPFEHGTWVSKPCPSSEISKVCKKLLAVSGWDPTVSSSMA